MDKNTFFYKIIIFQL